MPARLESPTQHCTTGKKLIRDFQEAETGGDCRIRRFDAYIAHLVFCDGCLRGERALAR